MGKSSLLNRLTGVDRAIVSSVAGTTRDVIDQTIKRNGKEYVFLDTAGVRRGSKVGPTQPKPSPSPLPSP